MVKYISGSIFESKCEAYTNPVNCAGVMGAGLALEFKRRYPTMFQQYRTFCTEQKLKLGQVMVYHLYEPPPNTIILFPTKFHWKEKSTTDNIELGLKALLSAVELASIQSVALPKLGCGLGGLDFEHEVKPLYEFYLEVSPLTFEVYI
jgi:O-acetyl-ADP-ribose deacetylase (regulator of RNase III)